MSKPLHEQIEADARELAQAINIGSFNALTPDQRAAMRALTTQMMGWAERAERLGRIYEPKTETWTR